MGGPIGQAICVRRSGMKLDCVPFPYVTQVNSLDYLVNVTVSPRLVELEIRVFTVRPQSRNGTQS